MAICQNSAFHFEKLQVMHMNVAVLALMQFQCTITISFVFLGIFCARFSFFSCIFMSCQNQTCIHLQLLFVELLIPISVYVLEYFYHFFHLVHKIFCIHNLRRSKLFVSKLSSETLRPYFSIFSQLEITYYCCFSSLVLDNYAKVVCDCCKC